MTYQDTPDGKADAANPDMFLKFKIKFALEKARFENVLILMFNTLWFPRRQYLHVHKPF